MKIDKYKNWEPILDMPVETYFISLLDESNSLTILLGELYPKEKRQFKILFDSPLMHRVTREENRLLPDDRISSNFNYSYNSDLLEWFHAESAGIHEDAILLYYVICNVDNIIEIITAVEGTVAWDYITE